MTIALEFIILVSFILLMNVYFYFQSKQKIKTNCLFVIKFRWTETFLGTSGILILVYPFIYAITKNDILIFLIEFLLFVFVVWYTTRNFLKLYLFNEESIEVIFLNLLNTNIESLIIPYGTITKAVSKRFIRSPSEIQFYYNDNGSIRQIRVLENGKIKIDKLSEFLKGKLKVEIIQRSV